MAYWVWENRRSPEGHKARIHLSGCGQCNNGKGKHPKAGEADEIRGWRGPFFTEDEALDFARKTGGNVSACKQCLRDMQIR
jgi:hypothetical protein